MTPKKFWTFLILLIFFLLFNFMIFNKYMNLFDNKSKIQSLNKQNYFDQILESRILFISGVGRSGTTLIRSILDTHELINCGPETPFLPYFIEAYFNLKNDYRTIKQTNKRGFNEGFIEKTIGLFFVYIMENKLYKSDYLCEKSPKLLKIGIDLHKSLPNAKFIYMIRDGRDVAYSFLIKFNESLHFKNFVRHLKNWNTMNQMYLDVCLKIGTLHCKMVNYTDLIFNTNKTMNEISNFLEIKWTDKFLNHQNYIGKEIFTIEDEWSHKQIIKPIYNDSSRKWEGKIIDYDAKYVQNNIKMLKKFRFL